MRLPTSNLAVVRELYNGIDAREVLENELDRAIDAGVDVILIEPEQLGEDTARWISLGNCLHRTTLVTSSISVLATICWEEKPYIYCPLSGLCIFCASFYHFSWKADPCSNYRTAHPSEFQDKLIQITGSSVPPVVLIRKKTVPSPYNAKLCVHATLAILATTLSAWKLYKWIKYAAF